MTRTLPIAVTAATLVLIAMVPVLAQSGGYYYPPKLIRQATTAKDIAGAGTVVVQVQVNANGSHRVIKVIHSTNSGDDAAALDIAQRSSYKPAVRGGKKVIAFYDFTLKFDGPSVGGNAAPPVNSGATRAIAALIREGKYSQAKDAASAYLVGHPGDNDAQQQLGVAEFFLNDYPAAAAAFAAAGSIAPAYRIVAAHAYAQAAVGAVSGNPAQSLDYGQRAVRLDPSASSYFALGSAQAANKDYAGAIVNLKKARTLAYAAKGTNTKSKVNLDESLISAYVNSGDPADAQPLVAEVKRLDPGNTLAVRIVAAHYMALGNGAQKAGNVQTAVSNYEQAASAGDTQTAVTAYAQIALLYGSQTKPDYTKMKSYADKAVAADPSAALANYVEGIALAGQWATGGGTDATMKKQAMDALTKADAEAKATGNTSLSAHIESFVKSTFKQ